MIDRSAILLERYRYLLEQKRSLNDKTFSLLAVYQSIYALACGGLAYLYVNDMHSEPEKRRQALEALSVAVCGVGVITIMLLVCGIVAWRSYKQREIEIEVELVGEEIGSLGRFDLFRWYETYIIGAVILSVAGFLAFVG